MPRIYTSDNDALDFCRMCYPKTEFVAQAVFANRGDGPDGRGNCFGYDAEHPDYDGEGYHCAACGDELTECDN